MSVVKGFSELYQKDIKPMYQTCSLKCDTIRNFKSQVVEVLKTTDNVIRKVIVYYPKTILIGTIANLIFTVLFPYIGAFIDLTVNVFFIFRHLDYMVTSIKEYSSHKKSEWFAPYEEKKEIEIVVYTKILGNDFIDKISGFFRNMI
ncbi:MAG: hypothetical protein K1060chlam4_00022 [Candidatus Anoxychlamydiales bacterium]|nr:hypothetical protein [Candidatus Anoxychlamydiales bacterium]